MKFLRYLRYLIRHKWFVFLECCRRGIVWRGLIHDWSKFLPSEFIPYMNHFYGDKPPEIGKNGVGDGDKAFDFAWLCHQKRNKHHWQWWVLPKDDGTVRPLPIKEPYRTEMLCDWIGVGRALGQPAGAVKWYQENKDKLQIHPWTRSWIVRRLAELDAMGVSETPPPPFPFVGDHLQE